MQVTQFLLNILFVIDNLTAQIKGLDIADGNKTFKKFRKSRLGSFRLGNTTNKN